MRYDKEIFFQTVSQGEYDPQTGDYGDPVIEETKRDAAVYSYSAQAQIKDFGKLMGEMVKIHLQNDYEEPFDQVRIGDKIYKVFDRSHMRVKGAFILRRI